MTFRNALIASLAVFFGVSFAGPNFGSEPDVAFPNGNSVVHVGVALQIDDRSPDAVWTAFIDQWLEYFDHDGSQTLSGSEAVRIFPLPLPDQRQAPLNFGQLDTNGDGNGSREELRSYYQKLGFTPLVVVSQPPSSADIQLSEVLFQRLDHDANGVLSQAELRRAIDLLSDYDVDEDEILTTDELLAGSKTLPTTGDATQKSEQDLVQPDLQIDATNATQSTAAKLHVNFAGQASINLIDVDEKLIQTSGASTANLMHVRIGQNDCDISVMEAGKLKAFQNVKSFYLAQFRTAFGEKITISKQQLSADASLKTLAALFDAADHDVDGNLSLSELRDFLTLLERGVASQTTITIGSHGHSLFNSLDANHDGRLNCGELNSASSRLLPAAAPNTTPNSTTASSISRDQIPIRYQLNFERGSPSNTFGPVQIPGRPKRATETTPAAVTKGPRWFERLDRNSDGLLSPAEFPGSIELFGRLDADHNGLISTDESQTK